MCREALKVLNQKASPNDWALAQTVVGTLASDKSALAIGEQRSRLLAEANGAYHAALNVYTPLGSPGDWGMAHYNLGNLRYFQASSAGALEPAQLLAEGVQEYRTALTVFTREAFAGDYAMTQNNLGLVLAAQAKVAATSERTRLLAEGAEAFRSALQVRTRETSSDWGRTQTNFANLLRDQANLVSGPEQSHLLAEAVKQLAEVIKFQPSQMAVGSCMVLLVDDLGDNSRAERILAKWLPSHPDDLGNRTMQIEIEFITERFAECLEQSATLAKTFATSGSVQYDAVRRVFEVMALTALEKSDERRQRLRELETLVERQPTTFNFAWPWKGAKRYVETSHQKGIQLHRLNLEALVEAASQMDRGSILAKLKALPNEPLNRTRR